MKQTHIIPIRLSHEKWSRYTKEATKCSLPLSTYLREKLEKEEDKDSELASIRRLIERQAQRSSDEGLLSEIILLLRMLAGPQKVLLAQKELERIGVEVWKQEEEEEA